MPLYEYQCQACNAEFELLVRNDDDCECPECHSRKLEKQLSAPAAPSVGSGALPVSSGPENCGRPQCGSGCMFGND